VVLVNEEGANGLLADILSLNTGELTTPHGTATSASFWYDEVQVRCFSMNVSIATSREQAMLLLLLMESYTKGDQATRHEARQALPLPVPRTTTVAMWVPIELVHSRLSCRYKIEGASDAPVTGDQDAGDRPDPRPAGAIPGAG
jgi:hypothetical protein